MDTYKKKLYCWWLNFEWKHTTNFIRICTCLRLSYHIKLNPPFSLWPWVCHSFWYVCIREQDVHSYWIQGGQTIGKTVKNENKSGYKNQSFKNSALYKHVQRFSALFIFLVRHLVSGPLWIIDFWKTWFSCENVYRSCSVCALKANSI